MFYPISNRYSIPPVPLQTPEPHWQENGISKFFFAAQFITHDNFSDVIFNHI